MSCIATVGRAQRERQLRVRDDLAVGEREERRLRPVADALHVHREPLLEWRDLGILLAGDVGIRLARHLVHRPLRRRPLGPGHDLDPLRRVDRRRLDRA